MLIMHFWVIQEHITGYAASVADLIYSQLIKILEAKASVINALSIRNRPQKGN